MQNHNVIVIAGFGKASELGPALANTFLDADYHVVGIARSKHNPEEFIREPKGKSTLTLLQSDVTDPIAMQKTIRQIEKEIGSIAGYIHNAAQFYMKPFLEIRAEDFEGLWQVICKGALVGAQTVLPFMLERKQGTLIFTGATASLRGGMNFGAFASAKFALRGLAQAMAREFGPKGIHVVHTIIDGIIYGEKARQLHQLTPEQCIDPQTLSEVYLNLLQQKPNGWTHELDVRPYTEAF